jgi:hypothetical protein
MSFRTVTLAAVVQGVSPHYGPGVSGEHELSLHVALSPDQSRQTGVVLRGSELRLAREDAEALKLAPGALVMLDLTVKLAEPQIDPLAETRVDVPVGYTVETKTIGRKIEAGSLT